MSLLFISSRSRQSLSKLPPAWGSRVDRGDRAVHISSCRDIPPNYRKAIPYRVAPYLAHADGIVELRDDDCAGHSDAHLGNRKNSVVSGNHNVTGSDHSGAAAETDALHQCDGRNRERVEPLDCFGGHPRGAQIVLWRRAPDGVEPFDVGAGLKIAALAGDHDDARRFAAGELVKGCKQRSDHVAIIGIVDLRALYCDVRNTT